MLAIGLMSGTSMDGIDAAIIETDGDIRVSELGNITIPYPEEFRILLKIAELAVRKKSGDVASAKTIFTECIDEYLKNELKLSGLEYDTKYKKLAAYLAPTYDAVIEHSTKLHAQAVTKLLRISKVSAAKIDVIGYHGQTLFHAPERHITIQAGDGNLLARETGIKVISDFRRRDVELGGQGAPFAPIYHYAICSRDNLIPAVIVNCGGIANVTVVKSDDINELSGFDTGPGNVLIDRLIKQRTHGRELFDKDGKYGAAGKVDKAIIDLLYKKAIIKNGINYFEIDPPKSLDYNDVVLIPEIDQLTTEDAAATLAAFTADSIVRSVKTEIPTWVLSGGGWNNPVMKCELKERIQRTYGNRVKVKSANEVHWISKALEAQVFAYLAVRSLQDKPISLPGTTRVREPLSGGFLHEPTSTLSS